LEGFYDNSPFHRVVKDFIAQSGAKNHDTGADGDCALGVPFFDNELHSRIRFVKRGMVACAGLCACPMFSKQRASLLNHDTVAYTQDKMDKMTLSSSSH
jgi:Cyclophilin type peptidyl-prolyl cis-trans isomerase/CLD